MNVRMFAALPGPRAGGLVRRRDGPHAVLRVEDDAAHFHRTCRDALAPFGDELHPIQTLVRRVLLPLKHRNEPRGIGGVFFDDFAGLGFERSFAMIRAVGDAFLAGLSPS